MSELISGKEALIAICDGIDVEHRMVGVSEFGDNPKTKHLLLDNFLNGNFEFRLKPRTITINGVELAPCYAVGMDHTKNEVSIQFNNNEDAVKLNNLLLNIYGFRNA